MSRPPGRSHGNAGAGPGRRGRSNTTPPPSMRPGSGGGRAGGGGSKGGACSVAVPVLAVVLLLLPVPLLAGLVDSFRTPGGEHRRRHRRVPAGKGTAPRPATGVPYRL